MVKIFTKGVKNIQKGKSFFSKWYWESWTAICKSKSQHILLPYTHTHTHKIKTAQRLKPKTWHHKTPGRGHKQNIFWCKSYLCYCRSVSQDNRNKNKWDLITLTSFCTTEETIHKMKRQSTEWEKIFANDATDKGLISKIYK